MSNYHANICKHICNLLQKTIGELKKEKQKKEKKKSHSDTSKVLLGGLVVEFG